MIPVTKTHLPSIEEYQKYLEELWQSGWLTNNGALIKKLEVELCEFLGINNLELVANGTLALQLAIKSLDLKGEIITTPYTYVATTTSIIWEGCEPVFVDIDEKTCCLDADLIESAITENTSAILATHVYGIPCDVEKIQAIAERFNLKVIYDAAHCFGVNLNNESVLVHGDCSILSFHATKLFHTVEGGAVYSNNEACLSRISLMKKFGHIGEEQYLDIGINAKMSELHAAMGLCVLPDITGLIERRKYLTGKYNDLLKNSSVCALSVPDNVEYNYAYYPVFFPDVDSMSKCRELLVKNDIIPRRYFSPSLNSLPYLDVRLQKDCPVSDDLSNRVLCLPLYSELEEYSLELICQLITNVCK